MGDNYNYPPGADTPSAPWNQVDPPEKEIEVTVSITLSKTVKITVDDYSCICDEDEDGKYIEEDYSTCDFKKAVKEQIVLPNEAFKHVTNEYVKEDLKDWNVDDFEVVLE